MAHRGLQRLGHRPLGRRQNVGHPPAEHCAHAAFLHRLRHRVQMPERCEYIAIDKCPGAVGDHLQARQAGADVRLFLGERSAERCCIETGPVEGGEVVGDEAAAQVLDGVDVRVHMGGQHHAARTFDDLSGATHGVEMIAVQRCGISDPQDLASADQHRAAFENSTAGVQGENGIDIADQQHRGSSPSGNCRHRSGCALRDVGADSTDIEEDLCDSEEMGTSPAVRSSPNGMGPLMAEECTAT